MNEPLHFKSMADPVAFKASLAETINALDAGDVSERDRVNLYRTSIDLFAAANWWGDNVSLAEFGVEVKGKRVEDHPLSMPLRRGMKRALYYSEITRIFWPGNLLYKLRTTPQSRTYGVQWVNPALWSVDAQFRGGLRGFRILGWGRRNERVEVDYIWPRDAIHLHGLDFDDDFEGVPPAQVAYMWAGINAELAQTALASFRNRMLPHAIVQPDKDGAKPTPEQVQSLTSFLRRAVSGSRNAGRTIVSPARWEWLMLNQDWKQFPLSEFNQGTAKAVEKATGVPDVLLSPDSGGFAVAEVARRTWGQAQLTPRLWWYADAFTEGLAREYGDDVRVVPLLEKLDFLKEDQATKVNTINAQVGAGYLTLYDAQVAMHHEDPDERLKDLYVVGGVPIPAAELPTYWQTRGMALEAPGQSGQGQVEDAPRLLPTAPRPERSAGTDETDPAPEQNSDDEAPPPAPTPRLPEEVYLELKNWQIVSARGRKPFEPRVLAGSATAAFLSDAVQSDFETEEVFAVGKAMYLETLSVEQGWERLEAYRSIDDYRRSLRGLTRGLWAGQLSKFDFVDGVYSAVRRRFTEAWHNAARDLKLTPDDFTAEEMAQLEREINSELQYVLRFADAVEEGSKANNGALSPLLARVELWVNAFNRIYNLGRLVMAGNKKQRWKRNPLKDSCPDCIALDNRVYRASTWLKHNIQPQSRRLACGGHHCGCAFEDSDDPVTKGRPPKLIGPKSALALRVEIELDASKGLGTASLTVLASLAWDADITGAMADCIREMGMEAGQWTPPEHYHITLISAPLVLNEQLEAIVEGIPDVANLVVTLERLITFEKDDHTVLALAAESEALRALQRTLYDLFESARVTVSEYGQPEQYTPHVTLAYLPGATELPQVKVLPIEAQVKRIDVTRTDYAMIYAVSAVPVPEA